MPWDCLGSRKVDCMQVAISCFEMAHPAKLDGQHRHSRPGAMETARYWRAEALLRFEQLWRDHHFASAN